MRWVSAASWQLSPQNIANPTWQFWRAGVGYVGQHGVARGGEPAAAMDSRASMAAAAATAASPGLQLLQSPAPCLQHRLPPFSWTKKIKVNLFLITFLSFCTKFSLYFPLNFFLNLFCSNVGLQPEETRCKPPPPPPPPPAPPPAERQREAGTSRCLFPQDDDIQPQACCLSFLSCLADRGSVWSFSEIWKLPNLPFSCWGRRGACLRWFGRVLGLLVTENQ